MIGKYKLAHIGGIARGHEKQFRACETALTLDGYICFAPVVYDMEVYKQHPDLLDDMCYEKLLICDLFVIATPEHIGKINTSCRTFSRNDVSVHDSILINILSSKIFIHAGKTSIFLSF